MTNPNRAAPQKSAGNLISATLIESTRTYEVPETRLPFVNGEIAQVDFQGTPHLVSGVWGATAGGRRSTSATAASAPPQTAR